MKKNSSVIIVYLTRQWDSASMVSQVVHRYIEKEVHNLFQHMAFAQDAMVVEVNNLNINTR